MMVVVKLCALVLLLAPLSLAIKCPPNAHLHTVNIRSTQLSAKLNVSVRNYPSEGALVPAKTAVYYVTAPCICRAESQTGGELCEPGPSGTVAIETTGDSFILSCSKAVDVDFVDCYPDLISLDNCEEDVPMPAPLVVLDSKEREEDQNDAALMQVTNLSCEGRILPEARLYSTVEEEDGNFVKMNVSVNNYPTRAAPVPSGTEVHFTTGSCSCYRGDNGVFEFTSSTGSVALSHTGWTFWVYCHKDKPLSAAEQCLPVATSFDGCPVPAVGEIIDEEDDDECGAPPDAVLSATVISGHDRTVKMNVEVLNYPHTGALVPAGTRISFLTGACICHSGANGNFDFVGLPSGTVQLHSTGWTFWLECQKPSLEGSNEMCLPIATSFDGCLTEIGQTEKDNAEDCTYPANANLRSTIEEHTGLFLRMNVSVENYPSIGAAVPANTEVIFSVGDCSCSSGSNGDFKFQGSLGSVRLQNTGWTFWIDCTKDSALTSPERCLPSPLAFDDCWVREDVPMALETLADVGIEPDDACAQIVGDALLATRVDFEDGGASKFEVTVVDFPAIGSQVPAGTYIEFTTGLCKCWQGYNGDFFFFGSQGSVTLSNAGYSFWLECKQPLSTEVHADCPVVATRFDNCSADGSVMDVDEDKRLHELAASLDPCLLISPESALKLNVVEDLERDAQLELSIINYPQFGMPVPAGTTIEFLTGQCVCHHGVNGEFTFSGNSARVTTSNKGWSLVLYCKHASGVVAHRDCEFTALSFDECPMPTTVPVETMPRSIAGPHMCFGPDQEGDIIIQAESINMAGSWAVLNDDQEMTSGSGYILWTGKNMYSGPREGFLTYNVILDQNQGGVYNVEMYTSRVDKPDELDWDEGNDVWISSDTVNWNKFLTSFGCPFCGLRPSRYGEWFFSNTLEQDDHSFINATVSFRAGSNVLELAGRSTGYRIDRIALRRIESAIDYPSRIKLANTEVPCP